MSNEIIAKNIRVQFPLNPFNPNEPDKKYDPPFDPLSSLEQKGKIIFDYTTTCCFDENPNLEITPNNIGFSVMVKPNQPLPPANSSEIKDFEILLNYKKINDETAKSILLNNEIKIKISLSCCTLEIIVKINIPICCGKNETTGDLSALPCIPKYDVRRYYLGKTKGRVVLLFYNQYGPDTYRIRWNGKVVSKLPDASNTPIANEYYDDLYKLWNGLSDNQKLQLKTGKILTNNGNDNGTAIKVFKDDNYYTKFGTNNTTLPNNSITWLGRQRDRVGGIGRIGFNYNPKDNDQLFIELEIISYTFINNYTLYCPNQYAKPDFFDLKLSSPCAENSNCPENKSNQLEFNNYHYLNRWYTYVGTHDCQIKDAICPVPTNTPYDKWQRWDKNIHQYDLKCCGICSPPNSITKGVTRFNQNCKPNITIDDSDCLSGLQKDIKTDLAQFSASYYQSFKYALYGDLKSNQMYRDIIWSGQKPDSMVYLKDPNGFDYSYCSTKYGKDIIKYNYASYSYGIDYPDISDNTQINGLYYDFNHIEMNKLYYTDKNGNNVINIDF